MRNLVLIFGLACFMVCVLPLLNSVALDPETAVGVWLFDEGAGDNVTDSSGKENHGEITGAKWKAGKFGDGLEFGGADSVSIDSTADLQLGDEHTMMAWFNASDIGDWRQIIAKNNEYLLRIDPPGEGNKMSTFVHIGGWEPRASANVPAKDTWIHYAATYERAKNSDQLVVYVNGVRAGASTRPGKGVGNADPVTIGRWNGGSFFVGMIDEVAIFKSVLTEEDLKLIMDKGLDEALDGVASVDPSNKLATTWGKLKSSQ
ncbi:MAG: LamG domain-containing protein [Candidatus Poribacteria bacterium]|nr:LamG domain-containing protein [Candidatus Poribacteria bacterium]